MSREAAKCLYSEALKLPFFHLEDVFLTGFAAEVISEWLMQKSIFMVNEDMVARHKILK